MNVGDGAQVRLIAEQIAEAVLIKFEAERPRPKEPPIHPIIKWLVGAIAALGFAALIGGGTWLVSSVSEMQLTLARMDERMTTGSVKDSRFDDLDRRVTKLEAYRSGGNP